MTAINNTSNLNPRKYFAQTMALANKTEREVKKEISLRQKEARRQTKSKNKEINQGIKTMAQGDRLWLAIKLAITELSPYLLLILVITALFISGFTAYAYTGYLLDPATFSMLHPIASTFYQITKPIVNAISYFLG
jgi:hypothetical protein